MRRRTSNTHHTKQTQPIDYDALDLRSGKVVVYAFVLKHGQTLRLRTVMDSALFFCPDTQAQAGDILLRELVDTYNHARPAP
jgi:hypothetical protein